MKIGTNRISPIKTAHLPEKNIIKGVAKSESRPENITNGSKELSRALMLMQTAKGIVQQALNVSKKLQTMATITLQTGQTNPMEIERTIAGIGESIKNYGGNFTSPPMDMDFFSNQNKPELPAAEIKEMANLLKEERIPSDIIQNINSSLEEKNRAIDRGFVFLSDRFNKANPSMKIKKNFENFDFPKSLKSDIINNSSIALSVQGNLENQRVLSLLR